MSNSKSGTASDLAKTITDSMQAMADISMTAIKNSFQNFSGSVGQMSKALSGTSMGNLNIPFLSKQDDCCAPKEDCPPHCILQITRTAAAGEKVMVPFMVKNNCVATKTYRLGLREMKNIDGTLAPSQPELNKKQVILDAGASELILLGADLSNFPNGNTYTTEIVIREKDINQNICFTLHVDSGKNIPVAEPVDEKKYLLKWQSWKSHFYCEPKKGLRLTDAANSPG